MTRASLSLLAASLLPLACGDSGGASASAGLSDSASNITSASASESESASATTPTTSGGSASASTTVTEGSASGEADSLATLQAPNRAHRLRTYFDPQGARVVERSAAEPAWSVHLGLAAIGRGEAIDEGGLCFLQRIAGRDEDPDTVETGGAAGGFDDVGVAGMGRVERSAHEADGEIARRRGEAQMCGRAVASHAQDL